jgi:hypothetical protein
MDKANELFHEIVVEKSREIYENMIAEEAEEDLGEEMDETSDKDDEAIEEETTLEIGGDAGDSFASDVSDQDAMGGLGAEDGMDSDMGGDLGGENDGSPEERISDLESELEQLKAEFEALMADEEGEEEHDDMFGDEEADDEEGDEEADDEEGDDEQMGFGENRQMTREYVEKVSDGHGADKKGRAETADNTRSPVSSANGRPSTTASAHNILGQGNKNAAPGIKGGEGLVGGQKGEFTKDHLNKPGGFKGDAFKKNGTGHGAEKKGSGEGQAYTKSPADRRQ